MFTGPDPTTETDDGRYIHSYPKIRYPSDTPTLTDDGEIIVQEKLDGGSYRVLLDDRTRVYGSKKKLQGSTPDEMNAFFRRPAQYIENTITPEAQAAVHDEYGTLTIFGESMLAHSLSYDWEQVPAFLCFDIWSHKNKQFLPVDTAVTLSDRLNLEFVPILARYPATDFRNSYFTAEDEISYTIPQSQFRDGIAEGVVFKNYDTQTFAKHVSPEFKEINTLRWGFTKRHESGEGLRAVDYTKYLVAQYATDVRIEKQLRKLVMDQGTLGMELMPELMSAVYEDIWAEHGTEIIYSGETVDMGRFHDLVTKRCRHRLKSIVENRDMITEMYDDTDLSDAEYLELMPIG